MFNELGREIQLGETRYLQRWRFRALIRCLEIWKYVELDMLLRTLKVNEQMRRSLAGLLGAHNRQEFTDRPSRGFLQKDVDGKWRIVDEETFQQTLKNMRLEPLSETAIQTTRQVAHDST